MTPNTRKLIINLAKRLRNSKGYNDDKAKHSNFSRFNGSLHTTISKVIINSFDKKNIFLINLLSSRLNEFESPDETLDFILKNFKIFAIVHFSDPNNTINCSCDDGSDECSYCEGSGNIRCDTCRGTGYETHEETGEDISCEICQGTGLVICDICDGNSYVRCCECEGWGYTSTDEYTDINVHYHFSMLKQLNNYLLNDNYDDKFTYIAKLENLISKGNMSVGEIRAADIDFTLNNYDYHGAINFDIDEKYYGNSYIIGVYDIFDPNVVLDISYTTFYIKTSPKIENILIKKFRK